MVTFAVAMPRLKAVCLALALLVTGLTPAAASSMTQKDVQILAKAIGFLQPPLGPVNVAIAYNPADPASKQDAEAIARFFGDGLKASGAILKPKMAEIGQLGAGGYVAVIAASGVKADQIYGATQAAHAACVTSDAASVKAAVA